MGPILPFPMTVSQGQFIPLPDTKTKTVITPNINTTTRRKRKKRKGNKLFQSLTACPLISSYKSKMNRDLQEGIKLFVELRGGAKKNEKEEPGLFSYDSDDDGEQDYKSLHDSEEEEYDNDDYADFGYDDDEVDVDEEIMMEDENDETVVEGVDRDAKKVSKKNRMQFFSTFKNRGNADVTKDEMSFDQEESREEIEPENNTARKEGKNLLWNVLKSKKKVEEEEEENSFDDEEYNDTEMYDDDEYGLDFENEKRYGESKTTKYGLRKSLVSAKMAKNLAVLASFPLVYVGSKVMQKYGIPSFVEMDTKEQKDTERGFDHQYKESLTSSSSYRATSNRKEKEVGKTPATFEESVQRTHESHLGKEEMNEEKRITEDTNRDDEYSSTSRKKKWYQSLPLLGKNSRKQFVNGDKDTFLSSGSTLNSHKLNKWEQKQKQVEYLEDRLRSVMVDAEMYEKKMVRLQEAKAAETSRYREVVDNLKKQVMKFEKEKGDILAVQNSETRKLRLKIEELTNQNELIHNKLIEVQQRQAKESKENSKQNGGTPSGKQLSQLKLQLKTYYDQVMAKKIHSLKTEHSRALQKKDQEMEEHESKMKEKFEVEALEFRKQVAAAVQEERAELKQQMIDYKEMIQQKLQEQLSIGSAGDIARSDEENFNLNLGMENESESLDGDHETDLDLMDDIEEGIEEDSMLNRAEEVEATKLTPRTESNKSLSKGPKKSKGKRKRTKVRKSGKISRSSKKNI